MATKESPQIAFPVPMEGKHFERAALFFLRQDLLMLPIRQNISRHV
jgi:hypothetical protein